MKSTFRKNQPHVEFQNLHTMRQSHDNQNLDYESTNHQIQACKYSQTLTTTKNFERSNSNNMNAQHNNPDRRTYKISDYTTT